MKFPTHERGDATRADAVVGDLIHPLPETRLPFGFAKARTRRTRSSRGW
jgi:hypothetical protein